MALIAITGASGYIGGATARWLEDKGHEIVAIVRRLTVDLARAAPSWRWIEWDILQPDPPKELGTISPDLVVHAATPNDILSRDAKTGHLLSIMGTEHVLDWIARVGSPRFVFLSTFQVYGSELEGIIDESTPVDCKNHYALNHWFGERLVGMRLSEMTTSGTILRPANVYGVPWFSSVDRGTLVPFCFCSQARNEGRIVIRSSGRQQRNFVHVSQIPRAVEAILRQERQGKLDTLNIASPHVLSIGEVAEMVARRARALRMGNINIEILGEKPQSPNVFSVSGNKWDEWVGRGNFNKQENRLNEVVEILLRNLIDKNKK